MTTLVLKLEERSKTLSQVRIRDCLLVSLTHNLISLWAISAVASGIVQGLGFGTNSMAAVVTRGCGELVKLGRALGAQPSTLAGLSGYGDLMLTYVVLSPSVRTPEWLMSSISGVSVLCRAILLLVESWAKD
jgi:hypothetical protein